MSQVVADETFRTGFLTAWLVSLPQALSTLIGVVLLCVSLGTLVAGARSLGIGTEWRRGNQSSNDEPGWLRGGVGGVIFGGITGGVIAAALLLLILSYQEEPRLNRWATFAILILPALALAAGGGRWQMAATICLSLLGAVSFALLLTCSAQITTLTPRLSIFFISLALLLAFTHWSRTQLFAIPITAALCAAHLFVLAVDCFTHSGFVDGTSLLVSVHGVAVGGEAHGRGEETVVVAWRSGKGKALIAGWWLLAICSAGWQIRSSSRRTSRNRDGISNLSYPDHPRLDRLFRRQDSRRLTEPTLLEHFKSFFGRRDSPPFAGFTELAGGRGSVVPWEDLRGSFRRSTLGFLNRPSSLHQHGPAAKGATSTYQAAERIPYGHASDTPPGETLSGESHEWTGNPSSTTKRDIAQAGSRQSQPDYVPLDLYGSSRHLDSHLGLDLPAFASRPAQYRPLLDESTTRRPLSALASLPSYHSAYSTDTLTLPTPSEPDSAGSSWTPARGTTAQSSGGGWRASSAELAHAVRQATRGTIERVSAILSRVSAATDSLGTRGIMTRKAPVGEVPVPAEVQDASLAPERRRSMDDWWAQVVQKSEEG